MIHFIRDHNNNTIVDIETLKDDLHVTIDIHYYSIFLLSSEGPISIVNDFSAIDELRSEWFETDAHTKYTPTEFIRKVLPRYAEKYNLYYVED